MAPEHVLIPIPTSSYRKSQSPNPKSQINSKSQFQNKQNDSVWNFELAHWSLFDIGCLEFGASMSSKPSLDNHFAFREEPDGFLPLSVQDPEEGIFHPAEGKESYRSNDSNIDSHIAACHTVLEFSRTPAILCKDRMSIAKWTCITD